MSAHSAPPPRSTRPRFDWVAVDPHTFGLDFPAEKVGEADSMVRVNMLLDVLATCRAGESFLMWRRYTALAAMHDQLVPGSGDADARLVSEYAQVASRYAVTGSTTQQMGLRHLNEALAMIHRLPLVGLRLRDGKIAGWQFSLIVSRTDLIDGYGYRHQVDAQIANALDRGRSWSMNALHALVDSVLYRFDPDAVRERHAAALDGRNVTIAPLADGIADMQITGSVENVRIAFTALTELVKHVCCQHDPRRRGAQRADAAIARLNGVPFECECDESGTGPCTGTPDNTEMSRIPAVVAMHVITEQATLAHHPVTDPPENDGVGFIDGHGVISGDQVRDIADRSDCRTTDLPASVPVAAPADRCSTVQPPFPPQPTLPSPSLPSPSLPSNPYRMRAAFATFIRARDLWCSVPGCGRNAWLVDLDHAREYNHADPAAGGQTESANVHPLCRFHHLLKTGDHGWLDDLLVDPDNGLVTYRIRTPEGVWIDGCAFTGFDLFKTLRDVRFADPPAPTCAPTKPTARARQPRTADKHARRQREREHNRARRERAEPPF